jgi:spore maturation protein CgeB
MSSPVNRREIVRERELERVTAAVDSVRERAEVLQQQRDELQSRLATAEKQLAQAGLQLRRVTVSRSWRLTAPLRGLRRRGPRQELRQLFRSLLRPTSLATASPPRQRPSSAALASRPTSVGLVGAGDKLVDAELAREARRRSAGAAAQRMPTRRRVSRLSDLRVAAVLDDMSLTCFGMECNIAAPTPADWRERLEDHRPHLLLVESAWKGNRGSWEYRIGKYARPESQGLPDLVAMVSWCRSAGIPAVFWNKEDPVHFDRFAEAASLFDVVFTSDGAITDRYEKLGGAIDTVAALPFAAQPRLHNPVTPGMPRSPEPVFAGTYYRNRHVERQGRLETLLDAAAPYGLVIYDRTFGSGSTDFGFPDRLASHVRGSLPYLDLVRVYKQHKVFLNTNSVVDSPTMFSRRVFELLACGTAVVSTRSRGMQNLFGDLVPVVDTAEETDAALRNLLFDGGHWHRTTAEGVRRVMLGHTYAHRLRTITSAAGIAVDAAGDDSVALAMLIDADTDLEVLREALAVGHRRPAEIVMGSAGNGALGDVLATLQSTHPDIAVRVVEQGEATDRCSRYRQLGEVATTPWIAIRRSVDGFETTHLDDLLAAAVFADADVIGHDPVDPLNPALSHRYVSALDARVGLVRREALLRHGWPDQAEAAAEFARWASQGVRMYCAAQQGFRPSRHP